MIKEDEAILKTVRLGSQTPVAELLKTFGRAPPLTMLELCYGRKEFNFSESLLQLADDLDFVQDILSAVGSAHEINPTLNSVQAGFNRRRRLNRFKRGHHNLELDRLRFATTASPLDSDLVAKEVMEEKKSNLTDLKRPAASEPCCFFQRRVGCRRKKCPYTHKCVICDVPKHGAIDCPKKRSSEATPGEELAVTEQPPDPRRRRARAR